MSKHKGDELPMPVVDFTQVGRKWTKEFGRLVNDAERTSRVLFNLQPEGSSMDAVEAFEEMYKTYQQKMEDIGQQQVGHISQILVSVPRECLVADAPEDDALDWDDPDTFDWMRQDVMASFFTQLQTGELAKKSAKN